MVTIMMMINSSKLIEMIIIKMMIMMISRKINHKYDSNDNNKKSTVILRIMITMEMISYDIFEHSNQSNCMTKIHSNPDIPKPLLT